MTDYPAHGSANWDVPLKGYIDAQDADVLAEALSEMQDLIAGSDVTAHEAAEDPHPEYFQREIMRLSSPRDLDVIHRPGSYWIGEHEDNANLPTPTEGFLRVISASTDYVNRIQEWWSFEQVEGFKKTFLPPRFFARQRYWNGWGQIGWGPWVELTGRVQSLVAGNNITIDNSDPENPIISSTVESEATPSFGGLTLSAAAPAVPELSNVNEWTVSDAVQVDLPAVAPGSQYTVHVISGFQNITWPNGTTVYGETDQDDVWVTLIRGDAGWNVLVPSPAPEESAAGLDTGWVALAVGMNSGGTVEWEVNPGAALDSSWGPAPNEIGAIRARRMGNTFYLLIEGIAKLSEGTYDQTVYTFPSNAGIDLPQNLMFSDIVPSATSFSAHGMARLVYEGNARRVRARAVDGTDLPVGTILGRYGALPGGALLSFPIEATSTWGT